MKRSPNHEILAGQPIRASGQTIIPFIDTWQVKVPGSHRSMTYSRPASILVRSSDGQETILPVPDLTRQVIWSLLAASLGAILMIWFITRSRR
jgi:hypothetical protein